MRRRDFIAAIGGAAAWPLSAPAQQRALPAVGLVSLASADGFADNMRAFHKGLGEAGYVGAQVEFAHVLPPYRKEGGQGKPNWRGGVAKRQAATFSFRLGVP